MIEKIKNADKDLFTFVVVWEVLILLGGFILMLGGEVGALIAAIISAIYFFLDYYVAGYFYFIAVDKGYADTIYLRFAFALTIVGYLMIIAMPTKENNATESVEENFDDLPEI